MNEKHAKLKKYNQEYWAQNKDTIKEKRDVKRSEASKEKNRVNARKYYQQHKQDICKKQRESEAYNAKRREYSRQYYWNNREKVLQKQRVAYAMGGNRCNDPLVVQQRNRQHYLNNKDKILERMSDQRNNRSTRVYATGTMNKKYGGKHAKGYVELEDRKNPFTLFAPCTYH